MKTPIEVHNGIPLGVPREWTNGKKITHKGVLVGLLVYPDDGNKMIDAHTADKSTEVKSQTAALEWIAEQIKETEE